MPQVAVMNNMNPTGPPNDLHPLPGRDQQRQRVDFSSRALESKRSSDGEGEGSGDESRYDSRYPNQAYNHASNEGKDDSTMYPHTPAQLLRETLATNNNYDTATASAATVSQFGRDFSRLATNTPGTFASVGVGQTPLTGASLGSIPEPLPRSASAGSGILKASNYATATVNVLGNAGLSMEAGISAMGLVRGNDPLGPTPLVRRNVNKQQVPQAQQLPTPSPGMHYHLPASDVKTHEGLPPQKKRGSMTGIEEEDPAMLRYASMAGSDQSPLVARGATDQNAREDSKQHEMDEIEASRTPPAQPQVLQDGMLRDPTASAYNNAAPLHASQSRLQSLQKAPAALTEFPFYFDGYASWVVSLLSCILFSTSHVCI
jgi:hypothetical protein